LFNAIPELQIETAGRDDVILDCSATPSALVALKVLLDGT
jgi:hypothetical protein